MKTLLFTLLLSLVSLTAHSQEPCMPYYSRSPDHQLYLNEVQRPHHFRGICPFFLGTLQGGQHCCHLGLLHGGDEHPSPRRDGSVHAGRRELTHQSQRWRSSASRTRKRQQQTHHHLQKIGFDLTQDIQTTIIRNIRLGKFFVDGENRDGYVESSGDSITYVYTNNISVYVPLTQLPDDADSLNKGVLDTIKDQVRDSSLVGLIGLNSWKKQSTTSTIAESYERSCQSSGLLK